MLAPPIGSENTDHGDFVATLEFWTPQTIFPRLERQFTALDLFEAHFAEEVRHVGESEDRIEQIFARFGNQTVDDPAAHAVSLCGFRHGERTNFSHDRGIKVQRAASNETALGARHREVADVLRDLEFRSGQHGAASGVSIDQIEQRGDVRHPRLAKFERDARRGIFGNSVGCKAANHDGRTPWRWRTMLVPAGSPAKRRASTSADAPGAISTSSTPCSSARFAASSFACIPPDAI